jgi:hypothetical protein
MASDPLDPGCQTHGVSGRLQWCHVHLVGTVEAACWIFGCDEFLSPEKPGAWTDVRPNLSTFYAPPHGEQRPATGCTDPVPLSEEPWGYHPPAA